MCQPYTTCRGDGLSMERKFPLDMFYVLRAYIRRGEEEAVELNQVGLNELNAVCP
jgi:hypothetical protein